MAYEINAYNVKECASVENTDTFEVACGKIADWINGNFDFLESIVRTASSKSYVKVWYKGIPSVGTLWGYDINSTYSADYDCAKSSYAARGKFCLYQNKAVDALIHFSKFNNVTVSTDCFNIANLKFIVVKTDKGVAFDFVRKGAGYGADCLGCVVDTFTNSDGVEKKATLMLEGYSGSTSSGFKMPNYFQIGIEGEDYTADRASYYDTSLYFLRKKALSTNTVLTRFKIPLTDLLPENIYEIDGKLPNALEVFELNGEKYFCFMRYGTANYGAFAFKL